MKYYFNINFYCKFIFLVLFLLFIIKGNATNINEAIKQTYSDSPHLKSLRAKLKASDEKIGKVLSKYRPNINLTSSVGADKTKTINTSELETTQNNKPRSISLELSQNLFDSGRKKYNINKTEAEIFAERSELISEEQKTIFSTAEVYLNVYSSKELYKLSKNNLEVLSQHYEATSSRFEVGEVTSTDLFQAEARLLKAKADEIEYKGNVNVERAKYYSITGFEAPNILVFPKKYPNLPQTLKEAINIAIKSNPKIIATGFRKKASFFDISIAASNLLPSIDLNLSAQNAWDPNTFFSEYEKYQVDLSLKIPLYQGGFNYSNIREKRNLAIYQSKKFDAEIRNLVRDVEVVWRTIRNLKYQLKAINASIKASETALKGVKEEAEVGTRTTLDVLDAEQELLEEKTELIKVKTKMFQESYNLLEKLGLLNPEYLQLNIKLSKKEEYYDEIKKLWQGFVQG